MKKIGVALVISLFLLSFAAAWPSITAGAIDNSTSNSSVTNSANNSITNQTVDNSANVVVNNQTVSQSGEGDQQDNAQTTEDNQVPVQNQNQEREREQARNQTQSEFENECEAWQCSDWSDCMNGTQTRTCSQVSNCTSQQGMPKTTKLCGEREQFNPEAKSFECPENCNCDGSTVKCLLPDGGRELTIYAGKSGNMIVQVQGQNMSTNVTLYKANGNIYGTFENNQTREIKLLPDQVKERIRERLSTQLQNENITLDQNGTYQYTGEDPAKLLGLFKVKMKIKAELNSETGDITELNKPWWAFLASQQNPQLLGASCGTVTPGQNDACCQSRGYDFWNATASQCDFNQNSSSAAQ